MASEAAFSAKSSWGHGQSDDMTAAGTTKV
jgi:hypothetical protein